MGNSPFVSRGGGGDRHPYTCCAAAAERLPIQHSHLPRRGKSPKKAHTAAVVETLMRRWRPSKPKRQRAAYAAAAAAPPARPRPAAVATTTPPKRHPSTMNLPPLPHFLRLKPPSPLLGAYQRLRSPHRPQQQKRKMKKVREERRTNSLPQPSPSPEQRPAGARRSRR